MIWGEKRGCSGVFFFVFVFLLNKNSAQENKSRGPERLRDAAGTVGVGLLKKPQATRDPGARLEGAVTDERASSPDS